MTNVNRCKEMDDAIAEAFYGSLPEDHPAYQPSTYTLDREEYKKMVSLEKCMDKATKA